MAKKMEVYKCEVCGNIVEVLHGGDGELVCCDQPMKSQIENTVRHSARHVVEFRINGHSGPFYRLF